MSSSSVEIAPARSFVPSREQEIVHTRRRGIPWGAIGRHAVLVLLCAWIVFPLAIVLINSVGSKVDSVHNHIWPNEFVHPLWARYQWLWTSFSLDNPFVRSYWNSLLVTSLTVVLGTIAAVVAGFALSHLSTPGKTPMLIVLVVSLFLPIQVTSMMGIFQLHRDLGLIDRTWALMFPYVAASIAISILVMRAVFQMVSKEIPDSARLDGASPFRILFGILLPIVRNGIVVVVIVNFMYAWSEYVLASVLMNDWTSRTLAVFMGKSQGPGISAMIVVQMIPSIVVLAIGQRWYAKALQEGALKG